MYCHFQSTTRSNIEDWKAMSTCNHMSIQYVNQSESLSWSFSDLSGGKWCLQRSTCADNMKPTSINCDETLDCRKFHKQLSKSCDQWAVSFCNVFGHGIEDIYFLIDIWEKKSFPSYPRHKKMTAPFFQLTTLISTPIFPILELTTIFFAPIQMLWTELVTVVTGEATYIMKWLNRKTCK
jgi:hypothetical protein